MKRNHPGKEVIEVEGVRNFRGLGGIKCGDKVFKKGMAYRCASLHEITENGRKTLHNLNIRYDFDLRTAQEKEDDPDPIIEGITLCEFDIIGAPKAGLTHERRLTKKEFLTQAMPMGDLYELMVAKSVEPLGRAFCKAVDCLIAGEPFLFHCTEGKDRTGIVAALILGCVGASDMEIIKDYLVTNDIAKSRARRAAFASLGYGFRNANKAFSYNVAKADYLFRALSYIKNHGGFETYAVVELGASREKVEKFRDICLE